MMNLMFEGLGSEAIAFEVCEAYRVALEHDEPVCASCGHLADDHDRVEAQVTSLRRRPARASRPVRKAS